MKTMNKILLAAALVLLGCLTGTKVVKADTNFSYDEASHKLSWTSEGTVAKLSFDGGEKKAVAGTSKSFNKQADLESFTGVSLSLGSNSISVEAYDSADTFLGSGTITVTSYEDDITCEHGTVTPTPGAGLKNETYSAVWEQDDEYALTGWNDGHDIEMERDDLQFGTSYTVVTEEVKIVSIAPTELTGGVDSSSVVVLSPVTADPTYLDYSDDNYKGCSVTTVSYADPNKDVVSFSGISGNGTFDLTITYNSAVTKTQKMKVKTNITDIVSDSYTIKPGEYKSFTIKTVPEGGVVDIKTTTTPKGVEDYDWTFTGTEGTLEVTTTEKASGNITFKFQSGTFTKDITLKVIKEEDVYEVLIEGPDQVSKNGTATYTAKVYLTDGSVSKQGVTWETDSPSTITAGGVLTARGNIGDTVTVTAKAVADETVSDYVDVEIVDKIDVGDLSYTSADDAQTEIKLTSGHKIDLSWKKGLVGTNDNASPQSVTYSNSNMSAGSFSGSVFTAKTLGSSTDEETTTIVPTIVYTKTDKDTRPDATIDIVVIKDWATDVKATGSGSSSSTSDDYSISFKLANKEVYTGHDVSKNLTGLSGYTVEVVKGDSVLASKTVEPSSYRVGESYKIDKDTLNELLKDASSSLSGDSTEVEFRISPYGIRQNSTHSKATNTAAGKGIKRTVYKDGDRYYLDKKGSSSSSSSSSKSNSAAGSGSGNAGAGLDKVPKTGEGNARLLIIMVAVISATIAGSILLSYMPAKAGAPFRFGRKSNVSEQTADRSESDPKEDHDQKI